jgi:hypothetical protein
MKAKDFDKIAKYEYYISKDVDKRGELTSIRFVGENADTRKLLEENGYVVTFVGANAIEYTLKKIVKQNGNNKTNKQQGI